MLQPNGSPLAGDPARPRREFRRNNRYRCFTQSYCQPGVGRLENFWWRSQIQDISISGIGLLLSKRFRPGTPLAVELPDPEGKSARKLLTRVVHAYPQAEGGWLLGCALIDKLSHDEIEALM